jgi:hypothetical protein
MNLAAELRSYSFYRFTPDRIKVFDEAAFGAAPFVEATVGPRPVPGARR